MKAWPGGHRAAPDLALPGRAAQAGPWGEDTRGCGRGFAVRRQGRQIQSCPPITPEGGRDGQEAARTPRGTHYPSLRRLCRRGS